MDWLSFLSGEGFPINYKNINKYYFFKGVLYSKFSSKLIRGKGKKSLKPLNEQKRFPTKSKLLTIKTIHLLFDRK